MRREGAGEPSSRPRAALVDAFNILDVRGAIGLSERVKYFGRMRDLTRKVAELFVRQRERCSFRSRARPRPQWREDPPALISKPASLAFEIGVRSLPPLYRRR